jgi:hypothetical protein
MDMQGNYQVNDLFLFEQTGRATETLRAKAQTAIRSPFHNANEFNFAYATAYSTSLASLSDGGVAVVYIQTSGFGRFTKDPKL